MFYIKYKKKWDVAQLTKVIFEDDVIDILKTISTKTWINELPNIFIELINNNFDVALESVKYIPNVYFKLNEKFKNDNQLINATIKSFRRHNKINEVNIIIKPLQRYNR